MKRLTSMKEKLGASTMKRSQMQDIGGCRAVLRNVAQVDALRKMYLEADHSHVLVKPTDYIANPTHVPTSDRVGPMTISADSSCRCAAAAAPAPRA